MLICTALSRSHYRDSAELVAGNTFSNVHAEYSTYSTIALVWKTTAAYLCCLAVPHRGNKPISAARCTVWCGGGGGGGLGGGGGVHLCPAGPSPPAGVGGGPGRCSSRAGPDWPGTPPSSRTSISGSTRRPTTPTGWGKCTVRSVGQEAGKSGFSAHHGPSLRG